MGTRGAPGSGARGVRTELAFGPLTFVLPRNRPFLFLQEVSCLVLFTSAETLWPLILSCFFFFKDPLFY